MHWRLLDVCEFVLQELVELLHIVILAVRHRVTSLELAAASRLTHIILLKNIPAI